MGAIECAEACGTAFHIDAADMCYCDPMLCALRTPEALAVSYMWEPDHCDFTLIGKDMKCQAVVQWFNLYIGYNIHDCRDFCLSQHFTAFSVWGTNGCDCCKDDASGLLLSDPGKHTFRMNKDLGKRE